MTATVVNKAQEKRDRQNTDYINASLRSKLLDFENRYLNGSVSYALKVLDSQIKNTEKDIADFPTREITKFNKNARIEDLQERLRRAVRARSLDAMVTLNAIVGAKKGYDERVDKLVALLVKEGFGYAHYKVEQIGTMGSNLEFIISKEDKTVHARLIFVEGYIVCPHFRFITTVRKN